MDYTKLIESLKGLIKDDSSPEQVEQITNIVRDVEAAKTENDDLIIKHEELRQKYIKALTQSTFKDNGTTPAQQEARPKTLEECIAEQIAKENK